MKMNNFYSTLLILIVLVFSTSFCLAQNVYTEPIITEKIEKNGTASYIIILEAQANLAQIPTYLSKEQKGKLTFELLTQVAQHSQKEILDYLQKEGVPHQSFYVYNSILVKSDWKTLLQVSNFRGIKKIVYDFPMRYAAPVQNEPLEGRFLVENWGIKTIQADSVWQLGFKGQGIVVGGQDTGYDWTHPAIKKKYRGYVRPDSSSHAYNWHDAIHVNNPVFPDTILNPCGLNLNEPCDDNSHGTHTMGTMVGFDSTDALIGIAPEARWVGVRNMDRGWGKLSTYMEAFQWLLAPTDLDGKNPKPELAPDVINNSWYCSESEGCNILNWGSLDTIVNTLKAAGIVVVVSVGNEGPNCHSATGPPGLFEGSFSVGATDFTDNIATFSSRGTVNIDGSNRLKPNVSAPGVGIPSCIPRNGYAAFSGTSMAGPHVVGLVALVLSANPTLRGHVDTIETIIEQTSIPFTSEQNCGGILGTQIPNAVFGYGRVNAFEAVKRAIKTNLTSSSNILVDEHITVFPNPTTGEVFIEVNDFTKEFAIKVFDSTGKLVSSSKSTSSITKIDLSPYSSGIFWLEIIQESGTVVKKVVRM